MFLYRHCPSQKIKTHELSGRLSVRRVKLRQNSQLTLLVRNYIHKQSTTE